MVDENKVESIKVIFLGESKVGKTSIIQRFIDKEFDNITTSTIGAASFKKIYEINDINIRFDIWDTAGQERFRGLGRMFYKDAQIGILVYDISSYKSFKELKDYWYNELIENSPKDIGILLYI